MTHIHKKNSKSLLVFFRKTPCEEINKTVQDLILKTLIKKTRTEGILKIKILGIWTTTTTCKRWKGESQAWKEQEEIDILGMNFQSSPKNRFRKSEKLWKDQPKSNSYRER